MNYILNNRTIKIPDKDIQNLQKTLELSKEEAIETWLSDNDYISDETVEELTKKAKDSKITGKIHGAKAETAKKERKPREKKENPLKKEIIDTIFTALSKKYNAKITNSEKYIDFSVDNLEFTVNLVQHRPQKVNIFKRCPIKGIFFYVKLLLDKSCGVWYNGWPASEGRGPKFQYNIGRRFLSRGK